VSRRSSANIPTRWRRPSCRWNGDYRAGLRRQQPELILDVSADPDYQSYLPETRFQMTIPLVSQDRTSACST
jgi:hypothetical protein